MKAQTSMDNLDQYGYNTTQKARPTDPQYAMGAVPGECIPAKWWNWFFNLSVKTLMADRADTSTIIAEINNVLTEAGITPDPSATNQFAAALINIKNTVGVANGLAPGYVKSSSANGEVSVNSTTGVMTGNGVGDINTITLPPNVEADVISVMNYFIVQIFGYGPVLPPNPFPAITQGSVTYFETHDLAGAGGRVPYIFCGPQLAPNTGRTMAAYSYTQTGEFTLEGGHWYRIVMSGAGGGGGGGSANTGSRSSSTVQSTTTYTSSITKGKNGAMGSPGALTVFDIYLVGDEDCFFILGYGGNGGSGGKLASLTGSGSSYTNTSTTPTGGSASSLPYVSSQTYIACLTHIQSTSNGNNGSQSKCAYTSYSSGQGGGSSSTVTGGNGADGGNGSGAILTIGNRMYSVSGGRGGKGNYTSGTRPRDYPDSMDQYINKYAYDTTVPAALAAVQKAPDIYDTSGGLGAWTPVSKNKLSVTDVTCASTNVGTAYCPLLTLSADNEYEDNGVTSYGQVYIHIASPILGVNNNYPNGNGGNGATSSWNSSSSQTDYNNWLTTMNGGESGREGYPSFIMIYRDDYTV